MWLSCPHLPVPRVGYVDLEGVDDGARGGGRAEGAVEERRVLGYLEE